MGPTVRGPNEGTEAGGGTREAMGPTVQGSSKGSGAGRGAVTLASGNRPPESQGTRNVTEAGGESEVLSAKEVEEALTVADAGHTAGVKMGNDPQIYPSRSI